MSNVAAGFYMHLTKSAAMRANDKCGPFCIYIPVLILIYQQIKLLQANQWICESPRSKYEFKLFSIFEK